MSLRALAIGVRKRLRETLLLNDGQCLVTIDGRPPLNAGQVFYAVQPGMVSNRDQNGHSLDESHSLTVVISLRAGIVPQDRYGEAILTRDTDGVLALAEAVRAMLHMDYTSMGYANDEIGNAENGFVEPLRYQSMSLAPVYPDWFGAESQGGGIAGITATLQFVDARRVQKIEEQS